MRIEAAKVTYEAATVADLSRRSSHERALVAYVGKRSLSSGSVRWPEIERKACATRDLSCRQAPTGNTLQSAVEVNDAMNQLEAPAQDPREHFSTVAESPTTVVPPPAPSSMLKGMKRHDGPEVDHDEQCQQEQADYDANQRGLNGSSDDCEPMVNYDGFESGGTFDMAALPSFRLADHDDDVVNVRSPIICKPSNSNTRRSTLSPTCVSALARDEVKNGDVPMPSWTIQEFQEYLGMLELLQDVCCNAEGEELSLSADNLGQMERLLTSLLPQGV